ncbi:hypothetical protein [Xanthobacter sp. 126]|uniref:hypothetical protein n=1 Tax=Xanthobacter sp. 126 TaxID=1131814 RepID=UPI00045EADF7|nr:hypothetical protein [Xanthobacter sp. 126]
MAADLASALMAVRARRAEEEEEEPAEVGEVDHEREDEADMDGLEDAARRSRDANLSRTGLIDFAQFRGVRLSPEEQAAPLDDLRKFVLDRLAGLAIM